MNTDTNLFFKNVIDELKAYFMEYEEMLLEETDLMMPDSEDYYEGSTRVGEDDVYEEDLEVSIVQILNDNEQCQMLVDFMKERISDYAYQIKCGNDCKEYRDIIKNDSSLIEKIGNLQSQF